MKLLTRLLPLFCLFLLAACTKPRDLVAEDRAMILSRLGTARIEAVQPPIGPWTLITRASRYYRVQTPTKTIWAEAYFSMWSLAAEDAVYRYRFYERGLIGWHKIER